MSTDGCMQSILTKVVVDVEQIARSFTSATTILYLILEVVVKQAPNNIVDAISSGYVKSCLTVVILSSQVEFIVAQDLL